jgi:predicted MPP superfamily phosphohydrolase
MTRRSPVADQIRRRLLAGALFFTVLMACGVATTAPRGPVAVQAAQSSDGAPVPLPNKEDSLKFGVIGDFGTGTREQYQVGEQMAKTRERFPFTLVLTVGDNLYGAERPQDFIQKFESPYRSLLDAGVKFYASLGNHDAREQRYYRLFNMDGKLYYSFKGPKQDVRFFALESTYMDREQLSWIEKELKDSNEAWKIPYFHHPLYSSGERHGSDVRLRETLEPLFVKYGVSVVLTGHDHFYERVKPQNGIVYFVTGSAGQLRRGNIDRRTGLTAKGFDTDQAFMAVEISGDEMYFNAISRQGTIIDSGVIQRRKPPDTQ